MTASGLHSAKISLLIYPSVSSHPSRSTHRNPVRGALGPTEAVPAASSLPQEPSTGTDHHPQLWGRPGLEPDKTRGTSH